MANMKLEQKAVQNQKPVRSGGATLNSGQGEQMSQFAALIESSPQSRRLAQLARLIDNSPRITTQRKLIASINVRSRPESPLPGGSAAQRQQTSHAPKANTAPNAHGPNTGLPANLKSGIKALSGISLDQVQVHYNSPRPAQLNALAYAQGTDIYVAPGQEHHLPHEAWHVVQQAQGRVQPTMQLKGLSVNDDNGLEQEANDMGARAAQVGAEFGSGETPTAHTSLVTAQPPTRDLANSTARQAIAQLAIIGVKRITSTKWYKQLDDAQKKKAIALNAEDHVYRLKEVCAQIGYTGPLPKKTTKSKIAPKQKPLAKSDADDADDESEPTGGAKRKRQLESYGYNVNSSTPATGYVAGQLQELKKRKFVPSNDDERLDQAMRQLTTPLLKRFPEAVEIQTMFVPKIPALFIATNKTEQNKKIHDQMVSNDTPGEFFSEIAKEYRIPNPGKTKKGARRKIPKAQQDNPLRRRSTKFLNGMKMEPTELEKKRGSKAAKFFDFIRSIEKEDVQHFNPSDPKEKFLDSDGEEFVKGLYMLEENLTVEGNPKVEEHAEVNFFSIIDTLGLKPDEFDIGGPKCPCATCRQKGVKKGVFSDSGHTGKLFPGQVPLKASGEYDEEFMEDMTKRSKKHGHVPSAHFQLNDSESDASLGSDSDSE